MRLADQKEQLEDLVDKLLKRIYAYIAWGVRRQSKSERVVFLNLEKLGFDIPPVSSRRVFDVVVPAALLVSLITFLFWIGHDIFQEKVFPSTFNAVGHNISPLVI
jgi:hypothetical protein